MNRIQITAILLLLSQATRLVADDVASETVLPQLQTMTVTSSLDGSDEPVRYWAPESANETLTPLLVFLHSWSSDVRQDNSKWHREAVARNWVYLHPNFRGANQTPKATGSKFARQDILDAMNVIRKQYRIDPDRVYLAGVSGGGHMAMLMAGHHPDQFTAVSAWVGISDLADWYQFHCRNGEPQKYAKMILKSLGQPPGSDAETDADYRDRSPVFHLQHAARLPVDLWAGVNDGHAGSVPVSHTLKAYNVLAAAQGAPTVTDVEMEQLWTDRKLKLPTDEDTVTDATLGREIRLRRTAGASRVTIFEGGHESIPAAACEWLANQHRR
ncbi:MAG: prolyl oligopeptidase family serine peptidase [Planctomycetaceae bacterium]